LYQKNKFVVKYDDMATKLIYFVRHGETELNLQNVRQGSEGRLTEKGRAQALAAANRFPKDGNGPEVIISSPYERTRETAEIIGKELGMPVEYLDLLIERRNPSQIVGHSGQEKDVKEIVDLMDRSFHPDNMRLADEENFVDLKKRASKLLDYIKGRGEKKIIMVTHSSFLTMIVSYMLLQEKLTASEFNELKYLNPINNAGIAICVYKSHWFKKDEWKLITWNDLVQTEEAPE